VAYARPQDTKTRSVRVASVTSGTHINEHMIMQRTASAEVMPDSLELLIRKLGAHQ
jgi:hypothetical protein